MLHLRHLIWYNLGQNHMPWYLNRNWNEEWTRIIDTVAKELRKIADKKP